MKNISIIVAHSLNNVIGSKGKIPWKIPGEQKQFKELTTNNAIVMGRNTYEEIGKALPNRMNIVITTKNIDNNDIYTVDSLQSAIELANNHDGDIYIIGGETLYKAAIDELDISDLYITVINMNIKDGDRYFPEFNIDDYTMEIIEYNDLYVRYHYYK